MQKRDSAATVLAHDELASLVSPIIARYGMASALLFGPYARHEADAASGMDLLLAGNPGSRLLNVFGAACNRC